MIVSALKCDCIPTMCLCFVEMCVCVRVIGNEYYVNVCVFVWVCVCVSCEIVCVCLFHIRWGVCEYECVLY